MPHKIIYFVFISIFVFSCGSKQEKTNGVATEQDSTQVLQKQKPVENAQEAPTLLDMLNTNENFSLFASYLNTNVSDMLGKEDAYTILVPNNKAIEQLGESKMTKLLNQGASFVKGHIIKGKFDVASLQKTPEITTLQGKKLKVTVDGDNITIGDAKVVVADVPAKNGVIHAIDRVIE
ncbi:MAG: fasciclin domain-containing protein [Raineya sp.]|jgi:uncharacterized surface protein with fasciclin (FAS1) repeats|nr:fasciclin domain-containing protein [Raineya sp.]